MLRQGLMSLRRGVRWVRSRVAPRAIILLYHRVTDDCTDPWALGVTPQHFAEHLAILRQRYNPLRLEELVAALRAGHIPRRAVVVTFDDGYADNLYQALPRLESQGVSATVFVTTQALEREGEFWWDALERPVFEPLTLPGELNLTLGGQPVTWLLGDDAEQTRRNLYDGLWAGMQSLPATERNDALKAVRVWAGTSADGRRHRTLTPAELRLLAQSDLIEIGAHTVSHPSLAALAPSRQRDEIWHSKARLEEMLGRHITSFAYPYGRHNDYTAETVALVQAAGFSCACSNFPGSVRDTALYQLPRFRVGNWDGDKFARRLAQWFRE